ncbi:hypothetical protein ACROYT_G036521 [Oculina patagonica]
MAFLLKELVFLAILATALTYPWRPMVNDIRYNTPKEQEDFPQPYAVNDGTDATSVEEPPAEKEPPLETNTDEKRGKESFVDEPPLSDEVYPLESKAHGKRARFYHNYRDPHFDENTKSRQRRGSVTSNTWRWPIDTDSSGNKIVNIPYELSSDLSSSANKWVKTIFRQLAQDTCINFKERSSSDAKYVIFENGAGCSSLIGYQANPSQTVSLGSGCEYRGTIAHEIMHLLGFYHEHTRQDRDQHITVYEDNIQTGWGSEFTTRNQNNFGYSYDKHSLMQYGKTAFGNNGAVTMESKSDSDEKLGAVSHMDANDLGKINAFYTCSNPKTFVDHTITVTTGNGWGDGTDGDVYMKLVGSSGTTPWQLITSGGEYDNEYEAGDIQKFYIPFPNVGTISSVQVALEAEGDVPGKKRRSIEKGRKMKRWFNGWGLENVNVDGASFGGDDLYEGDEVTLDK